MAAENDELQDIKSAAQAALSQWMAYLEPICRTLAAEKEQGADPDVVLPKRAICLLLDAGYLEGLRLKALGILSGDLLGLIQELALSFEVDVRHEAPFKLPFVGGVFALECKSMNSWRVEAWRIFHGGLLSAYALQPLHLLWQEPHNPLEAAMVVREGNEPGQAKAPESPGEFTQGAQNLVTGILNYSTLILKDPSFDGALAEKVGLIQEAARKLAHKLSHSGAAAQGHRPSAPVGGV